MKIRFALASAFLVAGCIEAPKPMPEAGLALAERSQCLGCHALDRKVIGPAWNDVSARYNGEIRSGKRSKKAVEDMLVQKISMGGKGNWISVTGGMSMPPNYPRVSRENIRKLAAFILSPDK